jgi:hypothetical protein
MSTITITEIGTIGANLSYTGIDNAGIFGPPGMSLIGQRFTSTFVGTCNDCRSFEMGFSPVLDATLTINGYTFDFGSGVGDDMNYGPNHNTQVILPDFTFMSLHINGGAFWINANGTSTSATFISESLSNSLNVPGPIAGADLPGLLLAMLIIFGGFCWKRQ